MIPVVTPRQMRAVDAAAPEPVAVLIDRAGRAVAREALRLLGGAYGRTVTVLAGPGNNGADGRTAAAVLTARGVRVRIVDATTAPAALAPCDLVIDAAYGTGFRGEWTAPAVVAPGGGRPLVLAVDVPSGLDALTGRAGPGVLTADRTVTFQALKPGLLFRAGRALAGSVVIADIGLDVSGAEQHLVDAATVAAWWPRRPADAHKWRAAVRIVAGSPGMLGAGRLCAAAAARAGAGLVSLSSPGADPGARDEIIQPPLPVDDFDGRVLGDLDRFGALVVGPGLGRRRVTMAAARRLILAARVPVVIDGDGLAAVAEDGSAALRERAATTVLTPHDREFERLHGSPPGDDRIAAAVTLAGAVGCVVLLKGPTTVVAGPDGAALVVANGDERLATAGTGDVLAGMIGAVMAAGVDPLRAAAAAAWIHADAASRGPRRGLVAGDLVDLLPGALAALGDP